MKLLTKEEARRASLRRWAALDQSVALQKKQRGFIIDPYKYGAGGGGPTDPYFANVISLLHMDDTDGSTTFADVFRTWTANGNAQIDTAQSMFGGSSGLFDGTDDDITTPHTTDFDMGGAEEYTIEGFARLANVVNYMHFWNSGDYATSQLSIRMTDTGTLQAFTNNGAGFIHATSGTFTANTWDHWAVSHVHPNNYLFIGGVLGSTDTSGGGTGWSGTGSVRIGSVWTSSQVLEVNGHLDEIRVTKGVGRYTATFTVPSAAFPDS